MNVWNLACVSYIWFFGRLCSMARCGHSVLSSTADAGLQCPWSIDWFVDEIRHLFLWDFPIQFHLYLTSLTANLTNSFFWLKVDFHSNLAFLHRWHMKSASFDLFFFLVSLALQLWKYSVSDQFGLISLIDGLITASWTTFFPYLLIGFQIWIGQRLCEQLTLICLSFLLLLLPTPDCHLSAYFNKLIGWPWNQFCLPAWIYLMIHQLLWLAKN